MIDNFSELIKIKSKEYANFLFDYIQKHKKLIQKSNSFLFMFISNYLFFDNLLSTGWFNNKEIVILDGFISKPQIQTIVNKYSNKVKINIISISTLGTLYEKLKNFNMFDCVIGNVPFGKDIKGGNRYLHYNIATNLLNIFNQKMFLIMPGSVIYKYTMDKNILKHRKTLSTKLIKVTELSKDIFPNTSMPETFIYEFHKNKSNNEKISLEFLNGGIKNVNSIENTIDILFNDFEKEILGYLKGGLKENYTAFDTLDDIKKPHIKGASIDDIKNKIEKTFLKNHTKNELKNSVILTISRAINKNKVEPIYGNSGIVYDFDEYFVEYNDTKESKIHYATKNAIIISEKESKNPKLTATNLRNALTRPLSRFSFLKTQNDQGLFWIHYKYIPNIDWTDERTKTDEGILEMCGCPKEKIKEIIDYVNKAVADYDNQSKK